jgi:hypothetical protein
MDVPGTVWMAACGFLVLIAAVFILLAVRGRRSDTAQPAPARKPDWMKSAPARGTASAVPPGMESNPLYDYQKGEKLASPFAEQVEDIIRARLKAIPALASIQVDLGTFPDGSLEISVDGKSYSDIDQLPDEQLRQVIRGAVQSWDQGSEGTK